jgi:NitT/TauT family transport system substrate-binding protein
MGFSNRYRRRSDLAVWLWSFLLVALSPLPSLAQLGGKPERASLTLSYTQASGAFTPLWLAQEAGLFKKHGLDATLKLLNSQVAHQALVAGELDVISSGPELINARLQGVPVKYIGGTLQRFVFQLWGGKNIKTLAELKGKTVAATTPKTSTEIATREALKKTAVIAEKDVNFIYLQTIPAILTAVINGNTAAGTLSAPNTLKARDAGLNLLIDIAQVNVPGFHLAYGTTEKTIKANPNLLYAFVKAVAEATLLAKQNPS